MLYARSIRRNIIFGLEKDDGAAAPPTEEEIIEAAKQVCVWARVLIRGVKSWGCGGVVSSRQSPSGEIQRWGGPAVCCGIEVVMGISRPCKTESRGRWWGRPQAQATEPHT